VCSAVQRQLSPERSILRQISSLMYLKIQRRQVIMNVLHPGCVRPPWWSPPVLWRRFEDGLASFCILIHLCKTPTHTHTHLFNDPLSGTTWVSRYQKGETNPDFTELRDSEWQQHQLGHMQVCTLLQTDNHARTIPPSFLQAGCSSCHPTDSVKALKAKGNRARCPKKVRRRDLMMDESGGWLVGLRTVNRGTVNRGTIKRGQLIAGQLIAWTHNRSDN